MSDLDKQFEETIKISRERIQNESDKEKKAIKALVEVGIYLKDIGKTSISNNFKNKINNTVDEFLELGKVKDFIDNYYFKSATEEVLSNVDFAKVYGEAQKDLTEFEGKDTIILATLGRTYAIHKYYEKYETPKARTVYYKVMSY